MQQPVYVEEYVRSKLKTPEAVLEFLLTRAKVFADQKTNVGDDSPAKKQYLATHGQHPYAVIITCSDSRVPPEHIFHAGVGELFVIRTAGNVVGEYELGSIEYGAEHLGAKVVLVLGHTGCGAVDAALHSTPHGFIKKITDEILGHLPKNCSCREAEIANVKHAIERIKESEEMAHLVKEGEVLVVGAIYDIATGAVKLIEN